MEHPKKAARYRRRRKVRRFARKWQEDCQDAGGCDNFAMLVIGAGKTAIRNPEKHAGRPKGRPTKHTPIAKRDGKKTMT
jgi:hypothetical protein